MTARAEINPIVHAGLGDHREASDLVGVRRGPDKGWSIMGEPRPDPSVADAARTATRSGGSLRLDGGSGVVLNDLPETPKTDFGIEAWVKPATHGGSRVVLNYGGAAGVGIEQTRDGVWGVVYGRATVGFAELPTDRWTHVALVVTGQATTLYINGRRSGSVELGPWGPRADAKLTIGSTPGADDGFFEGWIDEVRLFTFAPGAFDTRDLLWFAGPGPEKAAVVEASIVFERTPRESGLTFERAGTRFEAVAGRPAWGAVRTQMPEMQWMRSMRLTFTDERFRDGRMPVVDIEVVYRLDTWGGMEVHADAADGSQRIGMNWGASPRWKTARFRMDNAHFAARDHGNPGNRLSSDGYDLRLYAPNAPLHIHSVRVRGYPRSGADLDWSRLFQAERPRPIEGDVLAFAEAQPAGLSFPLHNRALEALTVDYRARIVDWNGQAVFESAGRTDVAPDDKTPLLIPFQTAGWAYGPYRYELELSDAGSERTLGRLEGGLMIHDGAAVPKARPGEFLYGMQHLKESTIEIDRQWLALCGVDFVRGLPGHGRHYDMARYERYIPWYRQDGVSLMAMFDPPKPGSPIRYEADGMPPQQRERELVKKEQFLERFAARYADEVTYYELGNEPDLKFFYPGPVEEYVDSFRRMRAAIKRGDPDAVVMTGGLCFFGEEGDQRARRIIELLAPDGVDAWAFHGHGPGYEAERDAHLKTHDAVAKHGGTELPFVETESGLAASGASQLIEQARTCVEKFVYAQEVGMPAMSWFALHFEGNDTYTSVENDREPRPVMLAYRHLVQRLRHHTYSKRMSLANGTVMGHLFERPDTDQQTLVIWATEPGTQNVRLSISSPDGVLYRHDLWGNTTTIDTDAGPVDLPVGEKPIYLSWRTEPDKPLAEAPAVLTVDRIFTVAYTEHQPVIGVRVLSPTDEPLTATLSGRVVLHDQTSRLEPVAVKLRPDTTQAVELISAPVVDNTAVRWPTAWRVFTQSRPGDTLARLDLTSVREIPASVAGVDGQWVATDDRGAVDLSRLLQRHRERSPGVLFAEVWSPVAQSIRVGAAADWWMQWFINGEPVYSTMDRGNGGAQVITTHVFEMPLRRGRNLVAVRVLSGSGGWRMVSGGPNAVNAALDSDSAPRRAELTLNWHSGQTTAVVPIRGAPIAIIPGSSMGRRAQPIALLGESAIDNPHHIQPDQSRWWQGDDDLSATMWATTVGKGKLRFLVEVKDDHWTETGDAARLTISPLTHQANTTRTSALTLTPVQAIRDEQERVIRYQFAHSFRMEDGAWPLDISLDVTDADDWGKKQTLNGKAVIVIPKAAPIQP